MSYETDLAQKQFLSSGGVLMRALGKLQQSGDLPKGYVFQEYPKMLRLSQGIQDVEKPCEDIKGKTWVETKRMEVFEEVIVHSEEEEERVLSGGKTSAQIEAERQALIHRARSFGLMVDPSWSAVRLRREMGEKLDTPEPVDEMGVLKEKLARLEEMAAMKARIARLEEELQRPADDADDLRSQLQALGVRVDGRWSLARLREELERATEPKAAV